MTHDVSINLSFRCFRFESMNSVDGFKWIETDMVRLDANYVAYMLESAGDVEDRDFCEAFQVQGDFVLSNTWVSNLSRLKRARIE